MNLKIQSGDRTGIVGVNGIGKSTLLKILIGELAPDHGEIVRAKNTSIAYLAQSNSGLDSHRSIRQEMTLAFAHLQEMEEKLREIEQHMGEPAILADEKKYQQLLLDYDTLSADFANKGGFTYDADIRGVLYGLNFQDNEFDTPVNTLSGGQKTRLNLARCLLGAPDLLILDEPTNYLDMDNLAWLERYLQDYRGAVLAVSHDRYFLDAVVKTIYDMERGKVSRYTSNYTGFVGQKAALLEQQLKAYKKQQEEIARMEDFVRRNIAAKDTTKRAQSRLKTLEKIERLERPAQTRRVHVSFGIRREANPEALQLYNIAIGYPGVVLSKNVSFNVGSKERVALIGPNGVGKTTLLKTIAGLLRPLEGKISTGTLVQLGYYDQEYQGLHPEKD
ncbi:MAG: ATP-binding cassette domain-containing protein, partial [Peptococcaceae bacterium]|nr:ATP-binding cassette domain-containing protein [Peptococcaceae bacterium]